MCEYLLHSDDDYAKAFRQLYKEHGGDFLEERDKKEEDDKRLTKPSYSPRPMQVRAFTPTSCARATPTR